MNIQQFESFYTAFSSVKKGLKKKVVQTAVIEMFPLQRPTYANSEPMLLNKIYFILF